MPISLPTPKASNKVLEMLDSGASSTSIISLIKLSVEIMLQKNLKA
jgi:hypothetical protein